MKFTVFEAGYGGPHSVSHIVSASTSAEAKRIVSIRIRAPLSELTAVKGTGKEAEQKFFRENTNSAGRWIGYSS
ncbi:MAG: hypothetical protein HRF40_09965 [Nitrososphaera sp.]|jgi:hypothetical protein